MNKTNSLTVVALALLLLAGCGGSLGDIYGGGKESNYEISGTVDRVETSSRSILLRNVSGYTSMLSSGGSSGNTVRVYYDDDTEVVYAGQTYRPQDLEPGDRVTARVQEEGNTLLADSMTVTHDVSGGTNTNYPDSTGSMLRGTVRFVDTSRRTIEVDREFGSNAIVQYETNTPVYFNGQTFRPADLEQGDEIEIRVRDLGSNRFSATDITVLRSISGGGGTSGSAMNTGTVRGTVLYVDTANRTIEIESASWINRFNTGTPSGSRFVIHYDRDASVDVSGRLHPVSGLERGDVIEVQVDNLGGRLTAERIHLVRNVRD